MIVYRVEDDYNNGPFSSDFLDSLSKKKRSEWCNHTRFKPTLQMEKLGFYYHDYPGYFTGTESIEQLDDWFKPFYRVLGHRGYYISKYDVDAWNVVPGETQLVFCLESAILLERGKRREFAP